MLCRKRIRRVLFILAIAFAPSSIAWPASSSTDESPAYSAQESPYQSARHAALASSDRSPGHGAEEPLEQQAGAPADQKRCPSDDQRPNEPQDEKAGEAAKAPAGPSVDEQEGEEGGRFLRLARDDEGSPLALEAAIVRCAPRDCQRKVPTVDLISAVHVAEKSYYNELNRLFVTYDTVLFELVAPRGTRVPRGGIQPSGNPVSLLQNAMTNLLELEFQLEGIDYTAGNLVHADMSPQQFAESMRRRGESMFQLFFRMLGYAMARQAEEPGGGGDLRLLLALFDENRALAIKRVLAEQFEDLEGSLNAIEGPDGSTLISERNKVALEVLREQIAAGKQKLAIFYGAGHMSDFERRLGEDFDLVPVSTRWLTAWDLRAGPAAERPKPSGKTPRSRPAPESSERVAP
jgi:hypothetical protein